MINRSVSVLVGTLTLGALFGLEAMGQPGPRLRTPLVLQECRLMLESSAISDSGFKEWKFRVLEEGGTHGGAPIDFSESGHEISVVIDKQWLVLDWRYEGKKIAGATFVVGMDDEVKDRVGILESPYREEDRLTVACGPASAI
jgi:hypothetical protein